MTFAPRVLPFVLLTLLASTSVARAQSEPPTENERKARTLSEQGLAHYNVRRYDQAIEAFTAAYVLAPLPLHLYNIAQAYRLKKDCRQSRRFYANFLNADPNAPNRESVEGRITEMDRCIRDADAAQQALAARRARQRRAFRIAGPVALGVGVVLIATGIYFSVRAADASSEVAQLYATGGQWNAHFDGVEASGRTASSTSAALYSVGGIAAVGGGVLTGLGWSGRF